MEENKAILKFHSDEVQEIMGRKPSWILRWGITTIVGILLAIILACCIIKYPQTVTASVTMTSDNPPADLAAKYSGILDSVYVFDGQAVQKGQVIALIDNPAKYQDIAAVETLLKENPIFKGESNVEEISEKKKEWEKFQLGDVQSYWIDLLAICVNYSDYLRIDQIGHEKTFLAERIKGSKNYRDNLRKQGDILDSQLSLGKADLSRDSTLYSSHSITVAEYDEAYDRYLSKELSQKSNNTSIASADLSITELEQELKKLEIQRALEVTEFERNISQARDRLNNAIAAWKEQYAIIAPYNGTVSLQNVWSSGQRVNNGDLIASVSPAGGMTVMGRMKVPSTGFGKVECGQRVNIRLNGFPYMEYGVLRGKVESISSVPERSNGALYYTVDVALPDGLKSSYKKDFPFVQDMDGTAEIITEDMRLIEQFIRPIRSLFKNR